MRLIWLSLGFELSESEEKRISFYFYKYYLLLREFVYCVRYSTLIFGE